MLFKLNLGIAAVLVFVWLLCINPHLLVLRTINGYYYVFYAHTCICMFMLMFELSVCLACATSTKTLSYKNT